MFRSLFGFLFVILLTSCGIESGKSIVGKIDTNGSKGASGTTSADTSGTTSASASGTTSASASGTTSASASGTTSTSASGTTSTSAGTSTSVTTSQNNAPPQIPESLLHLGGN